MHMRRYVNLLEGAILPSLGALAAPIMATSLIQMAYNLVDMIWIGRISAEAVAAVGAAGMGMWFSNGVATLTARSCPASCWHWSFRWPASCLPIR